MFHQKKLNHVRFGTITYVRRNSLLVKNYSSFGPYLYVSGISKEIWLQVLKLNHGGAFIQTHTLSPNEISWFVRFSAILAFESYSVHSYEDGTSEVFGRNA